MKCFGKSGSLITNLKIFESPVKWYSTDSGVAADGMPVYSVNKVFAMDIKK